MHSRQFARMLRGMQDTSGCPHGEVTRIISAIGQMPLISKCMHIKFRCIRGEATQRISKDWEDTGWRRLIASPKLQIIFHKRAATYRALLLRMTYKDKGSYESSLPCIAHIEMYAHQIRMHQWRSHTQHIE